MEMENDRLIPLMSINAKRSKTRKTQQNISQWTIIKGSYISTKGIGAGVQLQTQSHKANGINVNGEIQFDDSSTPTVKVSNETHFKSMCTSFSYLHILGIFDTSMLQDPRLRI